MWTPEKTTTLSDDLILFLLPSVYFLLGFIVFYFVEGASLTSSFYMTFILNYQTSSFFYVLPEGFMVPKTIFGRIYYVIHTIAGFLVFFVVFSRMLQFLLAKEEQWLRNRLEKSLHWKYTKSKLLLYKLLVSAFLYFLCFVIGVIGLYFLENWPLGDTMIYCWVLIVSLGDVEIAPKHWASILLALFVVTLTGILLTFILTVVFDYLSEVEREKLDQHYFNSRLDALELEEMDQSHKGCVSFQEYFEFILVHLELCDAEMIQKIKNRFKELDADQSGTLSMADLKILSNRKREGGQGTYVCEQKKTTTVFEKTVSINNGDEKQNRSDDIERESLTFFETKESVTEQTTHSLCEN